MQSASDTQARVHAFLVLVYVCVAVCINMDTHGFVSVFIYAVIL